MENLAAYTAPGCDYPEYVSINQDGDFVKVTVRGPHKEDGSCGETVTASVPADTFRRMLFDAAARLAIL